MNNRNIVITKKFLEGLKKAHAAAKFAKQDSFTYDGYEFVTTYAGYFIEFYGPKFGVKP